MSSPPRQPADVTALLAEWSTSERRVVLDRLFAALHDDLLRLARAFMARERRNHTLQATSLVNEAYLRLADQRQVRWNSRAHFLNVAAASMRRILVDHARRRQALKRPQVQVDWEEIFSVGVSRLDQILPVHEAIERLAVTDARQALIIELRFFAGLTVEEISDHAGVSPATVKRDLLDARTTLQTYLRSPGDGRAPS